MQIFMNLEDGKNLEEIIKYNISRAKQIRSELVELNKPINHTDKIVEVSKVVDEKLETPVSDSEEEYRYYYDNMMNELKDAKEDDIKDIIYSNLPVVENKDYSNLIRRIVLELVKEKYEYEELKNDEDEDTIKELSEEQKKIDDIINIIREHATSYTNEEQQVISKKKNKLIFLETFSGSIYVEGDLASIDQEYYGDFKELLESIEDGTFKNVKRFASNHNTLKGITEVKGFQVRIVFDKIDNDTYIIIDAFIKKTDRNLGYLEQLCNRVDVYKKNKASIVARINEEYLEENEKIYENLKEGLDSKNIIKTKRYR